MYPKCGSGGEELGRQGYTIIIHGKYNHAETQATHSHTEEHTKTLVVFDATEAEQVAAYITRSMPLADFERAFAGKSSEGFDPQKDLERVAVVNQTTMLAEETQEVAAILRRAMRQRYGEENLDYHCADTNDTLCYATHQNQNATRTLLSSGADLALVVGGYNSSNTSHLVELCLQSMPSFLIANSDEILSDQRIRHFDVHDKKTTESEGWLPRPLPVRLIITSGGFLPGCPHEPSVGKGRWLVRVRPHKKSTAPLCSSLRKALDTRPRPKGTWYPALR